MIVQHNITGEISRAARMAGDFRYRGALHPAGTVIVFLKGDRKVFTPDAFARLYTELPDEAPFGDAAFEPTPAGRQEVSR